MASLEGSAAVMSKALESQKLMAELVTEAAKVMDQDAVASTGNSGSEAQAEVSAAVSGLGRVLDLVV